MRKTLLFLHISVSLYLVSWVFALEQKPGLSADQPALDAEKWERCLSLQHGSMISCLQKELKIFTDEASKKSGALTWEAPLEAEQEMNPVAVDEKALEDGKVIYIRNCLGCHGDKGHGDGPTAQYFNNRVADLTHASLKERSDGALFWKITEGTWPMPAFGSQENLSREDIWKVIHYIREMGKETSK